MGRPEPEAPPQEAHNLVVAVLGRAVAGHSLKAVPIHCVDVVEMVFEPTAARANHWDRVYRSSGETEVSWFQREPQMSLELLNALGIGPAESVIDVGGGASVLVDALVRRSFADLCVLDVSAAALDLARSRLGDRARGVEWLQCDVLTWRPSRAFDVWHDRAVFHFLGDEADRRRYVQVLRTATAPGSHVILGVFAADGPDRCSGLPVTRYDPADLASMIGAGFDVVARRREEHRTPSGAVQPFTWLALRRL